MTGPHNGWGRAHAAIADMATREAAERAAANYRAAPRWAGYDIRVSQSGSGLWFVSARPKGYSATPQAVWVESVCRTTGARVSCMPIVPAPGGPDGYAKALCDRLTAIGCTDWRICDPQPSVEESKP